jgi:hypothetical protein
MARRVVTHRDQMSMSAQLRWAYADQTRFQQDFGEDFKSGEPLDEQQLRFIDYLRRFHDMKGNATNDYHPRPTLNTAGIQDNTYPPEWKAKAEQLARDSGGFSIHDDPNFPGDGPSSGYQVAIPGHERTDISTGEGWAGYAHDNQDILKGNSLGTWRGEDDLYYTEPSETIGDYDDAARATVDRNQWSMWDNGAHYLDPATGEKVFLPQADIPRTDIINQGLAGATGFTLARRHR